MNNARDLTLKLAAAESILLDVIFSISGVQLTTLDKDELETKISDLRGQLNNLERKLT